MESSPQEIKNSPITTFTTYCQPTYIYLSLLRSLFVEEEEYIIKDLYVFSTLPPCPMIRGVPASMSVLCALALGMHLFHVNV